jgi:N-acetylmuramoyl-L-alanine amidase
MTTTVTVQRRRSHPATALLCSLLAAFLLVGSGAAARAAGPVSVATEPESAAAATAVAPAASSGPLAGIVIAIDPGHNGGNAAHASTIARRVWIGTMWKPCNKVGTATRAGYPEHRFNFLVAGRLRARLEALGATVRMTRTNDSGVGPCITVRGRFGAKVGAALEVSIHADGSALSHRGFFVMKPAVVKGWTDDIAARSAVLARAMRNGLASAGLPVANYYAKNGIVTRRDLGTLNCSDVPVVEIELGNMKNATDASRMTSSAGRDRYAAGLAAGIRAFLGR